MTEKTENQTTQTEAQVQEQQPVDLTINDLAALRSIIDVAAQRGTFKPSEMAAVGTVYNKLNAFLDQVAKQAEAQKEQTPQE